MIEAFVPNHKPFDGRYVKVKRIDPFIAKYFFLFLSNLYQVRYYFRIFHHKRENDYIQRSHANMFNITERLFYLLHNFKTESLRFSKKKIHIFNTSKINLKRRF